MRKRRAGILLGKTYAAFICRAVHDALAVIIGDNCDTMANGDALIYARLMKANGTWVMLQMA